ncbi:MAG: helix-turn-helix transcriptional regulator [Magnetococcales bacterium]|nr:helix-turn-helix transcriptional regulator [Magnetococcales bacterium]
MSTINAETLSNFGSRLRSARKRLGLNQAEFGEKSGIARDTISRYERDEFSPSAEVLAKMVKALGKDVTADWLLFGESKGISEEQSEVIKLLNLGTLVGMGFDKGGKAYVSMGVPEITRILNVFLGVLKKHDLEGESLTTDLESMINEISSHERSLGFSILAEVVIASRAINIEPVIPTSLNENNSTTYEWEQFLSREGREQIKKNELTLQGILE